MDHSAWPIAAVLSGERRLQELTQAAIDANLLDPAAPEEWHLTGATKSRKLKQIIKSLTNEGSEDLGGDLSMLAYLAKDALAIRLRLDSLDFWKEVFEGLSIGTPVSVELIEPQGRCNYAYRIGAEDPVSEKVKSYVVRYHDPIGREFLPRHAPETAVRIYSAAGMLFRAALGPSAVCETRFPNEREHFAPAAGPPTQAECVRRRIVIQDDYSPDHFLLSQYANQAPPMPPYAVVRLYAAMLARLHARTKGIIQHGAGTGPAGGEEDFHGFRDLLRFADSKAYGDWLEGSNWVSQLARSGWRYRPDGPVWRPLRKQLHWSVDQIESRCKELWRASAAAVEQTGALLHSDYAPHNCFLDRATRSQLRLFDFDYVFFADPAYDIGLATNSLIRLLASTTNMDSPDSLRDLVDRFFTEYEREYERELGPTGYLIRSLISRGRAFAGLTLAATLDDDMASGKEAVLPSPMLVVAAELLQWLDGEIHEVAVMVGEILGDKTQDSRTRALLRTSIDAVKETLVQDGAAELSRGELHGEWYELTREVLHEFAVEEEMVRNNLCIIEDRPRRFFAVLPLDEDWEPVLGADPNLDARYRRIGLASEKAVQPRLDILLPVTKGYRRTFQSLASLRYDVESLLDEFRIEFHICVNFTDENSLEEASRFARTMARSSPLGVTLYSVDPREGGSAGSGWRKTTALNLMLRHIVRDLAGKDKQSGADKHYLHFADNDIVLPLHQKTLRSLIDRLRHNPGISIVSAAYTCEDDYGFSAIASVRKRKEYVRGAGPLLNLYGGCMTTTLWRLQQVLGVSAESIQLPDKRFSEDCYLTVRANTHLLQGGSNTSPFGGFADTRVTVCHPEPANIVRFVNRVGRDRHWGKSAKEVCLEAPSRHRFDEIRAASYGKIGSRIKTGPGQAGNASQKRNTRDMLALAWNFAVRRNVKLLCDDDGDKFRPIPESEAVDWIAHKTQHQICKDIVRNRDIYESVLRTVRKGAFGSALIHLMQGAISHPGERFPEMSWLLVQTRRNEIAHVLRENPYLFHWYTIAEESVASAIQFLEQTGEHTAWEWGASGPGKERKRELCAQYSLQRMLAGWKIVRDPAQDIDSRPSRQRESYTVFLHDVRGKKPERFLRHYNIIGRGRFAANSPRRMIYLHVLGDRLIRAICDASALMGAGNTVDPSLELVKTLYPTLATATINYAGPEPRSHAGRFFRCVYLQESIRKDAQRSWAIKMGDQQCEKLAACLGNFLGRIHGATFGIRSYLDERYVQGKRKKLKEQDQTPPFVDLLIEHLNHVRLFQPAAFRTWMRNGVEFPGSIPAILEDTSGLGGVAGTIAKLLDVEGLQLSDHWTTLCDESEFVHVRFGSLGHMGLYFANLFLSHNFLCADSEEPESVDGGQRFRFAPPELHLSKVYIANHANIAMIDPAVEAGLVLAELINCRISTDVASRVLRQNVAPRMNERSLRSLQKVFLTSYGKTLETLLLANTLSELKLGSKKDIATWKTRTCRMAAFALISRFHNRREYNLTEKERTQLVHISVDLLHQGVEFPLQFR